MSSVAAVIDALYSRFLLRDLFGKIVPGSIVLMAVDRAAVLPDRVLGFTDSGFVFTLWAAGLAWLTAFAVQHLGTEVVGWTWIWPPDDDVSDYSRRYEQRRDFNSRASLVDRQQAERLVVIKEATGNASAALALSLCIVVGVAFLDPRGVASVASDDWRGWVLMLAAAIVLRSANHAHAKKQYRWISKVLEGSE